MKINIITYTRTKNYGGILQAYGLYRYLQLEGYDVMFIDYVPSRCNINDKKAFVDDAVSRSKIWGYNIITKWLFSVIRYPAMKRAYKPFIQFMDTHAMFTKAYYSEDELEQDIPNADVYITGSDQVWNSQFVVGNKIDRPFYLPFVNKGKRISYASSFGKDSIPDGHKRDVAKYISAYNAVSVREQTGKKLLSELSIPSTVVVDPTILCPIEEWDALANITTDKNYILMYLISFNETIYQMALSIADVMGKKLICISLDNKDRRYVNESLVVTPSIEEWLSYIKQADGVITDSYHACVFSVLFHRQFIVNSGTRKGMSSRIINLLSELGLESRIINSFDPDIIKKGMVAPITWKECDDLLKQRRKESIDWLKEAIEK